MKRERYYRVTIIDANGTEKLYEPCLKKSSADTFCDSFNYAVGRQGHRAVKTEVAVASIKTMSEYRKERRKRSRRPLAVRGLT